jgi:elongator complex protein 1
MSTQRFGFEGGGTGREGRHDVIFFERNGLRHGEFSLKVDQLNVKGKGPDHGGDRKWGYRVRELAWNSDSTVLAAWIEGDDGDVGKGVSELSQAPAKSCLVQFWTMGNYHWYVYPHRS